MVTSQRKAPDTAPPAQTESPRLYAIDLEWYQAAGRSLEQALKERRCSACQEEMRRGKAPVSAEEHLHQVRTHCSRKSDYLGDRMPLMEVVFRLLLRGGNAPKSIEELYRDLSAHLEARPYSRVLPLRWVERIVSANNPYGVRQVDSQE